MEQITTNQDQKTLLYFKTLERRFKEVLQTLYSYIRNNLPPVVHLCTLVDAVQCFRYYFLLKMKINQREIKPHYLENGRL